MRRNTVLVLIFLHTLDTVLCDEEAPGKTVPIPRFLNFHGNMLVSAANESSQGVVIFDKPDDPPEANEVHKSKTRDRGFARTLKAFSLNEKLKCGRYRMPPGAMATVQSKNFGLQNYLSDDQCTWNFQATSSCQIFVQCPCMDIELSDGCKTDYVRLSSHVGNLRYCGQRQSRQTPFISPSDYFKIKFATDGQLNLAGFMCLVACVKPGQEIKFPEVCCPWNNETHPTPPPPPPTTTTPPPPPTYTYTHPTYTYPTYTHPTHTYPTYTYPTYTYPTYTAPPTTTPAPSVSACLTYQQFWSWWDNYLNDGARKALLRRVFNTRSEDGTSQTWKELGKVIYTQFMKSGDAS